LRGSMATKLKLLQGHMLLSSLVWFLSSLDSIVFVYHFLFYCFTTHTSFCLDTFIQKTKKLYLDTRTQRNLAKLNDELYEVHQIMTRNVQEVLGVGEKLDRKISFIFCQCFIICKLLNCYTCL
jgi:hypothetical protein